MRDIPGKGQVGSTDARPDIKDPGLGSMSNGFDIYIKRLVLLTDITEGNGREGDIEILEAMAKQIKQSALCALGNTAPNPVLTTIKYFREEYEAHIKERRCPAKECKSLIQYSILPDKCTGCTLCARNCPVNAITGERKETHVIDLEKCVKCGICKTVCNFEAVNVESRG